MSQRPVNHIELLDLRYLFFFGILQNSNSGHKKSSIFIDKVPFSHHPWTRLTDNNKNAKEEQIWPSASIQNKCIEVSFAASGMEKKKEASLFWPNNNLLII